MEEGGSEKNSELIRLWRVWKTTRQMLFDRGYEILQDELNVSLEEFGALYADLDGNVDRKKMAFSLKPTDEMIAKYQEPATEKRPNPPPAPIGTVWVEFNGDSQLGVKQIRTFAHHIQQNNFYTGILITNTAISSAATKVAAAIAPKILEYFQESDLLVNITLHELVPKHVLLSVEEKKQLLERYRLKDSQLPRIQRTDPVARYLGLRRGQVVKIIRRSTTAGRYASYRWVIG